MSELFMRIPKELKGFKGITIANRYIPGIYFLYLGNEIQYIGQSINVMSRINDHFKDNAKKFDSAFYFPAAINDLNILESALITKFNPPLNCKLTSPRRIKKLRGEWNWRHL